MELLRRFMDAYEDYLQSLGSESSDAAWGAVMDRWRPLSFKQSEIAIDYAQCRSQGTSRSLAEMFAARQAPSALTDREFLRGHGANGAQFQDCQDQGDVLKAVAESHGQSVKGKVYLSQLARFPGDPLAWVDGRGDVERVARLTGANVEGDVTVRSFEPPRAPAKKRKPLRLPVPDAASAEKLVQQFGG